MNKETKEIINLLGKNDWFDSVFMNTNSDIFKYKEFASSQYKKINWLLRSKNNNIYFIGVWKEKIIASTADVVLYSLHEREEFYLIPFYLFAREYLDKNNLNNFEFNDFLFYLKRAKSSKIYSYIEDMVKYIDWYKEQSYPLYEYIPRLEIFLKEQLILWKDKFEEIKKEEIEFLKSNGGSE